MVLLPPSQPYIGHFRRVVWATLVLGFVVLACGFLSFNQVVFILFIAIVIGTVIRPIVSLVVSARAASDSGGYSCLPSRVRPVRRLRAVIVPIARRARYNDCRRCARLLSEPARVDGKLSQSIRCSLQSVPPSDTSKPAAVRANGTTDAGYCRAYGLCIPGRQVPSSSPKA